MLVYSFLREKVIVNFKNNIANKYKNYNLKKSQAPSTFLQTFVKNYNLNVLS